MTALLDIAGASFTTDGKTLVDDVTIGVDRGEVVALVGPNGAGKTSTVRLIGGDIEATAGTVRLGGGAIGSLNSLEAAKRRAVMAQHTTVRFPFRALDVVVMGRFPLQTDRATDLAVARELMERTETIALADSFFPVLSGGEQARVNLARAMAQEAPLLVLDEPTASLDLRHEQLVMRLLRQSAATGAGCLVVLHDLNLAATYADRLVLMHRGAVVTDGSPEEVLDAALLSEVYQQLVSVVAHPERDGLLVLVREA